MCISTFCPLFLSHLISGSVLLIKKYFNFVEFTDFLLKCLKTLVLLLLVRQKVALLCFIFQYFKNLGLVLQHLIVTFLCDMMIVRQPRKRESEVRIE